MQPAPGLKFYCRFIFLFVKNYILENFFHKISDCEVDLYVVQYIFCFVFMHEPEIPSP